MRVFILVFFALFVSACASKVESFIQTSNEGIFIKTTPPKTISIKAQNSAQLPNALEEKLKASLIEKGFIITNDTSKADFEILLNIIDFKRNSYAQRLSSSSAFFFYGPFMRVDYDYNVENFYTLQVNLAIVDNFTQKEQKTSLFARTNYLANAKQSQKVLEDRIITQILSFFYLS